MQLQNNRPMYKADKFVNSNDFNSSSEIGDLIESPLDSARGGI